MRIRPLFAACLALGPLSSRASSATSTPGSVSALDRRQASGLVDSSVFLRRAYHSSAVLDGWLYIDGGEFAYSTTTGPKYQYSTSLVAIDLSQDFTTSSVSITSIEKPADVPSQRAGGLWVDESTKLLYTGFAGRESVFAGTYQATGLWSFAPDGTGSGTWSNLNSSAPTEFRTIARRWYGQSTSGGGKGYFLGGYLGNTSTDVGEDPVPGMLVYDFASNVLKNLTSTSVSTGAVVQKGGMLFVPNFGSEGLVISIGGAQRGKTDLGQDFLLSMSTAQIYDPAKELWYDQSLTGSPPPARKEYCVAGAASSNRTFEILVYAGWEGHLGTESTSFDVAYVLSLPAFRWFKADYSPIRPRHGLTCNSIGGGKILTIGGVDTLQNDNSYPYGLYAHVFDTADPFKQGLGIFDLSTMAFNDSYKAANRGEYTLNTEIQDYYNKNGRSPTYDSTGVSDIFAVESFTTVPSATGTGTTSSSEGAWGSGSSSNSTNIGAVVGGAVAGAAVVALIAIGVFFFMRKKKRAGATAPSDSAVYMHVAGGGWPPNKRDGPYDPTPPEALHQYQQYQYHHQQLQNQSQGPQTPSELSSHNHYGGGGGQWPAQAPQTHAAGPGLGYAAGPGYDQPTVSTDSKQQDVYSGVYYPPQTYELQSQYFHELSPGGSLPSLSQSHSPAAVHQIHEVQSHQDGPAATPAEYNYKYNMRF